MIESVTSGVASMVTTTTSCFHCFSAAMLWSKKAMSASSPSLVALASCEKLLQRQTACSV